MIMPFISSLYKDQKSSSFLSVGCQRLCLLAEFVLGCDFVCLVRLFIIFLAFLISLPTTYALYLLRQVALLFLFPLLYHQKTIASVPTPIRCSYLCNFLISMSDINWWFQLLIL